MSNSFQFSRKLKVKCSVCNKSTNFDELVKVYATACNDYRCVPAQKICGYCLVNYHVPVFRRITEKWEFGKVLSYSSSDSGNSQSQKQYQVQFTNCTKEWVSLGSDPYEEYIDYFNEAVDDLKMAQGSSSRTSRHQNGLLHSTNEQISKEDQDFLIEVLNPTPHSKYIFPFDEDFSIDNSEKKANTSHPSEELISQTKQSTDVDRPLKKTKLSDSSKNQGPLSPITRCHTNSKFEEFGSPVTCQTSSLTTHNSSSSTSCDNRNDSTCSRRSNSVSSSRNDDTSSTGSNHRIPRLWTPKEDECLLKSIALSDDLCWPKIATGVPDRTGKQCRERYLNHLRPHLKRTEWSPLEDATLFRLHATKGSKWSQIVKVLPGRTDNGIKNRYHNLRNRFEKRMKIVPDSEEMRLLMKQMAENPSFQSLSPDPLVSKDIAARILNDASNKSMEKQALITEESEYEFGPFDQIDESRACGRCGLIVPSQETGSVVCRTTGWCKTCTGVSLVISGDLLRATHLVMTQKSV